jgi:serine/threonine-protein kinase RsbT
VSANTPSMPTAEPRATDSGRDPATHRSGGPPARTFMALPKSQTCPLRSEPDVVDARRTVRQWATELNFSLVELTKIVTAASELARNTVIYGGGGEMRLEQVHNGARRGLRIAFIDQGPGIPDLALAMKDGYTTGTGLGLGLGGAKRLVNEFEIESKPGAGTRVTITRWR